MKYRQMKIFLFYIFLFFPIFGIAQKSLDSLLKQFNNQSIPYITVQDLRAIQNDVIILDAREKEEYTISHIKNAQYVGYQQFSIDTFGLQNIPKNKTIVVYCSLGIRSEDISEKIKEIGYHKIFNLYGGIFEWKNKEYPIVDNKEEPTENVHPYSDEWSGWLQKGKKVYSY